MKDREEILIVCSPDAVDSLRSALDAVAEEPATATERRNFDGNVPVWVLGATVAISALPHLVSAMALFIGAGKVVKYQVGDVMVENPKAADLDLLRQLAAARLPARDKHGGGAGE